MLAFPQVRLSRYLRFALGICLVLILALPALAGTAGNSADLNAVLQDVGGSNSGFNWTGVLNWLVLIVVPVVAVLVILKLIQNIQQDHSIGSLVLNGIASIFTIGLVLLVVVLPQTVAAKAKAAGALVHTTAISPR